MEHWQQADTQKPPRISTTRLKIFISFPAFLSVKMLSSLQCPGKNHFPTPFPEFMFPAQPQEALFILLL